MGNLANGKRSLLIYGDCGYPIKRLPLYPYFVRNLKPHQEKFNNSMKAVKLAVEWQVVNEFIFFDLSKLK